MEEEFYRPRLSEKGRTFPIAQLAQIKLCFTQCKTTGMPDGLETGYESCFDFWLANSNAGTEIESHFTSARDKRVFPQEFYLFLLEEFACSSTKRLTAKMVRNKTPQEEKNIQVVVRCR